MWRVELILKGYTRKWLKEKSKRDATFNHGDKNKKCCIFDALSRVKIEKSGGVRVDVWQKDEEANVKHESKTVSDNIQM